MPVDPMTPFQTARIVGIGGGTGLPILLAGLRRLASRDRRRNQGLVLEVSAIVSVADNGGSSGRLRSALRLPAMGDLRNCVTALADDRLATGLFQHRFLSADELHGHSLGNLMLAALCQRSGSLARAADEARALVHALGNVLPVTESPVDICARFADGHIVRGEVEVAAAGRPIERVWLESSHHETPAVAGPGVLEAIAEAKMIVLGPGSLHTSLLPNLAVPGVAEAIRETMALRVLVCNLMTQPGETDGYSAADHIRVIEQYLGERVLDVCIIHGGATPTALAGGSGAAGPVKFDYDEIVGRSVMPLVADVAAAAGGRLQHDPDKLAAVVAAIAARTVPVPATSITHLKAAT